MNFILYKLGSKLIIEVNRNYTEIISYRQKVLGARHNSHFSIRTRSPLLDFLSRHVRLLRKLLPRPPEFYV